MLPRTGRCRVGHLPPDVSGMSLVPGGRACPRAHPGRNRARAGVRPAGGRVRACRRGRRHCRDDHPCCPGGHCYYPNVRLSPSGERRQSRNESPRSSDGHRQHPNDRPRSWDGLPRRRNGHPRSPSGRCWSPGCRCCRCADGRRRCPSGPRRCRRCRRPVVAPRLACPYRRPGRPGPSGQHRIRACAALGRPGPPNRRPAARARSRPLSAPSQVSHARRHLGAHTVNRREYPVFQHTVDAARAATSTVAALSTKMSGGVLLSHAVPRAVPSALKGLTSGFGMGPGVSPSPWPPKLYGDVRSWPTAPREPHSGRMQNL
jgi:hypothetical protein